MVDASMAQEFRDKLNRIGHTHGVEPLWELADQMIRKMFLLEKKIEVWRKRADMSDREKALYDG